jgi:hypothetical protein
LEEEERVLVTSLITDRSIQPTLITKRWPNIKRTTIQTYEQTLRAHQHCSVKPSWSHNGKGDLARPLLECVPNQSASVIVIRSCYKSKKREQVTKFGLSETLIGRRPFTSNVDCRFLIRTDAQPPKMKHVLTTDAHSSGFSISLIREPMADKCRWTRKRLKRRKRPIRFTWQSAQSAIRPVFTARRLEMTLRVTLAGHEDVGKLSWTRQANDDAD